MPFLMRCKLLAVLLCAGLLCAEASAQAPDAPASMLRLAPGQDEIVARGTISGYQTIDYAFDGFPGAEASIVLDHAGQASLYHNVIAPSGATLFNGSMDGARFQAVLRERGRYRIRIYLMRNDARRGKVVGFTLRIRQFDRQARPPLPPLAGGPSFDCRRARGAIEPLICRSAVLSELDGRLDAVYRAALASAAPRRAEQIRLDQRAWLGARDACIGEREIERCLGRQYTLRIGQLAPRR